MWSDSGHRGTHRTDGLALAGYCVVCGLVASVAGAASSLWADGTRNKLIVWGVVALAVALAGGVGWGYGLDPVRRLVNLTLARPGQGAAGNGRERHRPR